MPRPLRVFLCHASQDKPAVRELYNALNAEGWIDPWLDKAKILPGQDWELVIEKAVDDSDVVIVCLSGQSVTKEGFVQREIRYAYDIALEKPEETIFLIPLRLDDCNVPRKLRALHWVDYFGLDKENSYSDLLVALKLRHEQILNLEAKAIARKQVMQMLKHPNGEHEVENISYEEIPVSYRGKNNPAIKTAYVKPEMPIFAMGVFSFVIISIFILGIYALIKQKISPISLPNETLAVAESPVSTTVSMELSNATELSGFDIGSVKISEKDGMVLVYVPAGEFTMGSNTNPSEQPIHQVNLDAFWIDQTEVTNAMYSKCVDEGECYPPYDVNYYDNSSYANHPVVHVDWNQATAYCAWAERRLPTEAEWEKVARGTNGRTYPWGEGIDCDKANYTDSCVGDTSPVKSYPNGVSPYGAYDMAGNVWEWVSSLYQPYPYNENDGRENLSSSGDRVLRGGSWDYIDKFVRSASRYDYHPDYFNGFFYVSVGFRCARSP